MPRLTAELFQRLIRDSLLDVHFTVDVTCLARVRALRLWTAGGDAEPRSVEGGLWREPAEDVE